MSPNDGGPAFPRPLSKLSSDEISHDQEGMTLRDYFAAQALVCPEVSTPLEFIEQEHSEMSPNQRDAARAYHFKAMAQRSYALADAMLAARRAN